MGPTNQAWIIEDDYNGEFRYDRQPLGALHGIAPDRVVYLGTASKTIGAALRVGWVVLPPSSTRRWPSNAATTATSPS